MGARVRERRLSTDLNAIEFSALPGAKLSNGAGPGQTRLL
jgi:hypothetical protein